MITGVLKENRSSGNFFVSLYLLLSLLKYKYDFFKHNKNVFEAHFWNIP